MRLTPVTEEDYIRMLEVLFGKEKALHIQVTINGLNKTPQYKQVVLVRKDLNMSTGKIAAQVSHASVYPLLGLIFNTTNILSMDAFETWYDDSEMNTIVLAVNSEEELLELHRRAYKAGLPTYLVHDAGRTEVEPGTTTVCSIGPALSNDIDKITGDLPLL